MLRRLIFVFVLFVFQSLWGQENYYAGLIKDLDVMTSSEIKNHLFETLSYFHLEQNNKPDLLYKVAPRGVKVYRHKQLDFNTAVNIVYNNIAARTINYNTVKVKAIYCEKQYKVKVPYGNTIRQALVKQGYNIEHAWPKNRFSLKNKARKSDKDYGFKVADLNHLKLSKAKVNRIRNTYKFAEVTPVTEVIGMPYLKYLNKRAGKAKLGTDIGFENPDELYFEPDDDFKGELARAVLYFSIRYKLPLDKVEEKYLRKWHRKYKVSPEEKRENEITFKKQRNRNPFIDYPEIESYIETFRYYD